MPNPGASTSGKLIQRILDAIALSLDKIADEEKAGAVESIVAMYANQARSTFCTDLVHEMQKLCYFTRLRWLL